LIAVTGGAGFIGSNLALKLLSLGHDVIILDNFSTGSHQVASLLEERGAKVMRGPSSNLKRLQPQAIFHLGMPSSSPMYKKDPSLVSTVVEDFVSIIETARKLNIPLIYASTSSLYNGHDPPHREALPVIPTDFYTEARYWIERLSQVYHSLYGVKSVGLRLFSVYGPNERPKKNYANVASQMVWAALEGEPFIIFGDGSQTRDFIYVSDVVKAFLAAWESNAHGIFNVGTGRETSFNEIASLISRHIPLRVEYKPNPIKNYVMRTCADTSLAEEVLGFKTTVDLERGIERIVEAYRREEMVFAVE